MNKVLKNNLILKIGTVFKPAELRVESTEKDNFSFIVKISDACYRADTYEPEIERWLENEER